ncbi:hypothetical protein [Paraburkholderia adhaesiva]|uniref:hypothetical protein n=1 Tax=Paraburkholderia adhaesiva TaxID=2883244 RepID=UPI001F424F15|nr:hypothetical protein [Paraburkholderia adhaesiva]
MKLRYVLIASLLLAACENVPDGGSTAKAVLTTFCRLHQAQIFDVLLTPKQIEAGHVICAAVGQPLGIDAQPMPAPGTHDGTQQ